jgi:uncharacterized protein (DUF488 family)
VPDHLILYTIGHGNRSLGEFLSLLETAGIKTLVDVRAQPGSTRFPHFSSETLRKSLEARGIVYHWAGRQLGGRREPRPGSRHTAIESDSLRAFADHMETEAFEKGIAGLMRIAGTSRTAILCAEKLPEHCHRGLIADYLTLRGIPVRHLIMPGEVREHQLDARARRESAQLIYDRLTSEKLKLE